MTKHEWVKIVALMQANWPHADIPKESLGVWYADVHDLDEAQVRAAASALCRDGREFPPNGGQLRAKVLEMSQAAELDQGAAWGLAMHAVRKFGHDREDEAMPWLEERSLVLAEAVRRFGWRSLCLFNLNDESTVRAQFRNIFTATQRAAERDARYAGLEHVQPRRLEPRSIKEIAREVADTGPKQLPEAT